MKDPQFCPEQKQEITKLLTLIFEQIPCFAVFYFIWGLKINKGEDTPIQQKEEYTQELTCPTL